MTDREAALERWLKRAEDERDAIIKQRDAALKRNTELVQVLEGLRYIHDHNPSDDFGNLTSLEYARHVLRSVRQTARIALAPKRNTDDQD